MSELSLTFHVSNAGNQLHNVRDPRAEERDNIDYSRTQNNIVFKNISVEKFYMERFQKMFEDWQSKITKRKDKSPHTTYLEHVKNMKYYPQPGEGYKDEEFRGYKEIIVQIGDRETVGVDSEEAQKSMKALQEFYHYWEKKYKKNFPIISASIHQDETDGTVHMHLEIVPIVYTNKKGMSEQVSMKGALRECGFGSKKKNGFEAFQRAERQQLHDIAAKHGLQTTVKIHGEERQMHLWDAEYKEYDNKRKAVRKMKENLRSQLESLKQEPIAPTVREELETLWAYAMLLCERDKRKALQKIHEIVTQWAEQIKTQRAADKIQEIEDAVERGVYKQEAEQNEDESYEMQV